MMNLEVHASSRGPTGESRGTPAPQHPVSQACVALHRQGCSGVSEPPAWALTPWEAVHSMHVTAPVQPSPSPRYIAGGNTAPGPVTRAATAGAGRVTGKAGGQCQVRLSSQSRAGGRATEVIGPHPGSRWPLGWGQYPWEEVPGGDKPDVVGGPRQVCVQLVGHTGQLGPGTSATMFSSLPRSQEPLGSTATPGEGAAPRAPGSSTRSGRSPAHTGPGAGPSPGPGGSMGLDPITQKSGLGLGGRPQGCSGSPVQEEGRWTQGAAGTTPGSGGWARAGLQGVWSAHEDRRGAPGRTDSRRPGVSRG